MWSKKRTLPTLITGKRAITWIIDLGIFIHRYRWRSPPQPRASTLTSSTLSLIYGQRVLSDGRSAAASFRIPFLRLTTRLDLKFEYATDEERSYLVDLSLKPTQLSRVVCNIKRDRVGASAAEQMHRARVEFSNNFIRTSSIAGAVSRSICTRGLDAMYRTAALIKCKILRLYITEISLTLH